jgi:hypothetical protein
MTPRLLASSSNGHFRCMVSDMYWRTKIETNHSGVHRVVILLDGPITRETARLLLDLGWRHLGQTGWGGADRWAAGTW